MELKCTTAGATDDWVLNLLIEPYGIEIDFGFVFLCLLASLLIEPYGIEMSPLGCIPLWPCCLLIEPYGIEIGIRHRTRRRHEAF